MWIELATALCLVLVIEGILPFLSPKRWRLYVAAMANMSDKQIQITGLISMLMGAGILMLIR